VKNLLESVKLGPVVLLDKDVGEAEKGRWAPNFDMTNVVCGCSQGAAMTSQTRLAIDALFQTFIPEER